ncbi:putative arabinose efflux permease, MFS family [Methanophagales archaeon]|nr:putative arabinose efflux permease, MFS family [Methanophagales archaeon]
MGVGPLLGGFLWHLFGMTSVFYAMSGISVIAFLLVLPFLPEVKNPNASKTEEHESFKSIIKHDAVKIILLIGFISAFRQIVLVSFLPSQATSFEINATQVGIIADSIIVCICSGIVTPEVAQVTLVGSSVIKVGYFFC